MKTRRQRRAADLVTALGVVHPFRPLCSLRTLTEHLRRLNGPGIRHLIEQEYRRQTSGGCLDALRYVVEHLAPAFAERDWNEKYEVGSLAPFQAASTSDYSEELEAATAQVPGHRLPMPSLWLWGRVWLLRPMSLLKGRLQIRWGETILGLTGEYVLANTLEREWLSDVQKHASAVATRLADTQPEENTALRAARQEVAKNGFWQCGDLLFLPGNPPRLGHMMPRHYNRVLGRESQNDLAATAPVTQPPQITSPTIYSLAGSGRWEPLSLPHGLCLGNGQPTEKAASPGLALAAYLRWAAIKIAANGKFHSSDE